MRHLMTLFVVVSIISLSLTSCRATKEELSAFMLNYIAEDIETTGEFLQTYKPDDTFPWWAEATEKNIIIWAPYKEDAELEPLDLKSPIRVWYYADGNLLEQKDGQEAITEFEKLKICKKFGCNRYQFSIVSLEKNEAVIYLGLHCGALCGVGNYLYLVRDANGEWQVDRTEMIWIS